MMKTAKFQRGGAFAIAEVEVPVPGPGEAVVRVAYCGICGSDLHMVDKGMLPGGAVIGHELSGTISALGPGVDGWAVDDPVTVMPLDPCLSCAFCLAGNTQQCVDGLKRSYGLGVNPGGFAEYMRVKSSMLYRIPDGLGLADAALTEPWAVAWHGVSKLPSLTDPVALVMGAGPIGLMCVFALKKKGLTNIYVSEPDPARAERAARAGAALVIDPKTHKPISAIVAAAGKPPDLVIDCAGTESSLQEAVSTVRASGTVLMLGIHLGKVGLLPIVAFGKEVTIKFSFGYTAREFGDCLGLLAGGVLDPDVLVSAVMPLTELEAAFGLLHQSGHSKVLINCRKTSPQGANT